MKDVLNHLKYMLITSQEFCANNPGYGEIWYINIGEDEADALGCAAPTFTFLGVETRVIECKDIVARSFISVLSDKLPNGYRIATTIEKLPSCLYMPYEGTIIKPARELKLPRYDE